MRDTQDIRGFGGLEVHRRVGGLESTELVVGVVDFKRQLLLSSMGTHDKDQERQR